MLPTNDGPVGNRRPNRTALYLALAVGLFAAGLFAAFSVIPEWRIGRFEEKGTYRRIFEHCAQQLGYDLVKEEPRFDLIEFIGDLPVVYRTLRSDAAQWLLSERRAVTVGVSQGALDSNGRRGRLFILMDAAGHPWYIEWAAAEASVPVIVGSPPDYERMIPALLRPGESESPLKRDAQWYGAVHTVRKVTPSLPPQFIFAESAGVAVYAFRNVSTDQDASVVFDNQLGDVLLSKTPEFIILLGAIILFIFLIRSKRLIYWETGLVISLATFVSSLLVTSSGTILSFIHLLPVIIVIIYRSALVFFIWVAAESLLVGGSAGSAPSLAALVMWRLSPRGGSQLLIGSGVGLAAVAVHLFAGSLAVLVPGVFPLQLNFLLQSPNFDQNPLYIASLLSALVILSEALVRLFKGSVFVALSLTILVLSIYSSWGPWLFGIVCVSPIAVLFWGALRKLGIAGLFMATLVYTLLPLTIFSGWQWEWLLLTCFTTATLQIALLSVGVLAVARPAQQPGYLKAFISYAHEDKQALEAFKANLLGLPVEFWYDQEIIAGYDFNHAIHEKLRDADILVVLVSRDLLGSAYCNGVEIRLALRRNRRGQICVIPVIIDRCRWELPPLSQVQAIAIRHEDQIANWQNWGPDDWHRVRLTFERIVLDVERARQLNQRPIWRG